MNTTPTKTLNGYQQLAATFAEKAIADDLTYMALGVAGESGEIANKLKKVLRGDMTLHDARPALVAECADTLWYVSQLARVLGYTLEEIAAMNIEKLSSRAERGLIQGQGDTR